MLITSLKKYTGGGHFSGAWTLPPSSVEAKLPRQPAPAPRPDEKRPISEREHS